MRAFRLEICFLLTVLIAFWAGYAGAQTCPIGDLDGSCKVEWQDLRLFAEQWLDPGCSGPACADLDGVNGVNMVDYNLLAGNWMEGSRQVRLVINEFMANNETIIQDLQGDYDDWIEIYNDSNEAFDIAGLYLTDDLAEPNKWRIPDGSPTETTIPPYGYLLIWADRDSEDGPLHVEFALNADGEEIGLFDVDGITLIDSITFGPQRNDESFGRFPDAEDDWRIFTVPTPGSQNIDVQQEMLHRSDVSDSVVVFNEIMYNHPTNDISLEWLEFYNQMAVDIDLSGWSVTGGIRYVFPQGTIIPGGGFVVLASSPTDLYGETGYAGAYGPFEGRLSNAGEKLRLRDNSDRIMNVIDYSDEGDWPVAPDGSGFALAKIDPDTASAAPENWAWSTQYNGTPGADNGLVGSSATLIINEVAGSEDPQFFIEIRNISDASIELENYVVASSTGAEYVLPAQLLPAGGYRSLSSSELGFTVADADKLFLYTPGEASLCDAVEVKRTLRGRSDQHDGRWQRPDVNTPGSANSFAFNDSIVINEIMYHHQPKWETQPTIVTQTTLLPIDANWYYNQSGTNYSPVFFYPAYDVSWWNTGQALFYVESAPLPAPKNTPLTLGRITYYFRTEFQFNGDMDNITSLALRTVIDDGAVFYLNGIPVKYLGMPVGPVSYSMLATRLVDDATYEGPFEIPIAALQPGRNVLAVEVHQLSVFSDDIVFGVEVIVKELAGGGTPFEESDEEWVELYNRGGVDVNLAGWQFDDGIEYEFAPGTILAAGEYLVVANDANALKTKYPSVDIVGDYSRRLSNKGERIAILDANGNIADEVRYYDNKPWPKYADGRGSSLELRNPSADNTKAEAWAASDESTKADWNTYMYRKTAMVGEGPTTWNEFIMGLLDTGEILIDDISVVEDPCGTPIQFIQNGTFETGAGTWRFGGNHDKSQVITDPDNPSNKVLRLVATGQAEHIYNHAETTFAGGEQVINGTGYEISFRAKWLAGSPKLNTRLYFNRVPKTIVIESSGLNGTPGAQNSHYQANTGPMFSEFGHSPAVPNAGQTVTVSVVAQDPDGVSSCTLWWKVDGGSWNSHAMTHQGNGLYTDTIPGQSAETIVQFYVQAQDSSAVMSTYPAAGANSRALYKVNDGQAATSGLHNFRIIMTNDDFGFLSLRTNTYTDDRISATVIYDEKTVYYDVGVCFKGSLYSRGSTEAFRKGYNVRFHADNLFRGVHDGLTIDRAAGGFLLVPGPQRTREILVKQILNHAGGISSQYDDLTRFIPPDSNDASSAQLQIGHFNNEYLDSQYENGGDGMLFKQELIYYPTETIGGPESPKVFDEGTTAWYPYPPIGNLGYSPDLYRHIYLVRNNRDRDDFSRLIEFVKAYDAGGPAFLAEAEQLMDVDQWLRAYAWTGVISTFDNYFGSNTGHNHYFYVRPEDNKIVFLPWDNDFTKEYPTWWPEEPPWPIRLDWYPPDDTINEKLLDPEPKYDRLYYGHMHDIITTTVNPSYLTYWAQHFESLVPEEDFDDYYLNFYLDRADWILTTQLPTTVTFEITTNGGSDFTVDSNSVALEGNAWINVREIRITGRDEPPELTWADIDTWQTTVTLTFGPNILEFVAYDFQGNFLASDTITVTSTAP